MKGYRQWRHLPWNEWPRVSI